MILLKDIILILFLAILIILITNKFKIPPIIGFLLTGIIIGPSALQLVDSISEIEILAEIGIIILMFTIGLEFSLEKIKNMKKYFFFFGSLQVSISWLIFFLLLQWYGLLFHQSLFGGFVLALSSTAIVFKLLKDKDELNSPSGIKIAGILLFQDAALIPFMIMLPFIIQFNDAPPVQLIIKTATSIGGIILIFIVSKILLPKIFNVILKERIPELLMVTVFVFLFGISFFTYKLGSSLAMGAFIAGVAISDSDYVHQINTEIIPSHHIFNSIFFISIGMFINITFLFAHLTEVIAITFLIIVVKSVIIILIFLISKYPLNQGFIAAFGLAHIGEFSFILLNLSQEYALFDQNIHQLLLSSIFLSMLSIPFVLTGGKKISQYKSFKKKIETSAQKDSLINHTIIAGFGINGQNIARILKLLNIPYSILEINPSTIEKYKSLGEPIYFGDIDRKDNLKIIGISKASLLVIAISDMEACKRAIKLSKSLNPKLKIIVRSNYLAQVETMYKLGADLVLSQDMETSLMFINHILKFYNMPDHVARVQTNILRKEHYSFFYKKESQEAWKIAIFDFIEQDNELFFIGPYSRYVSKKIESLAPYHYNDMEIIGVIRKNQVLSDFSQVIIIEKFDTIIFSGNHKKVAEAMAWMEENN